MGAWRHVGKKHHHHAQTHHRVHRRHTVRDGIGVLDLSIGGTLTVPTHSMELVLPLQIPVPLEKLAAALGCIVEIMVDVGDTDAASTWEAMQKVVAAAAVEPVSSSSAESDHEPGEFVTPSIDRQASEDDFVSEASMSLLKSQNTATMSSQPPSHWDRQCSHQSEEENLRLRLDALEVEHAARSALIDELSRDRDTLAAENRTLKRKLMKRSHSLGQEIMATFTGHFATKVGDDLDDVEECKKQQEECEELKRRCRDFEHQIATLTEAALKANTGGNGALLQQEHEELKRRCRECEQEIAALTGAETRLHHELDAAKADLQAALSNKPVIGVDTDDSQPEKAEMKPLAINNSSLKPVEKKHRTSTGRMHTTSLSNHLGTVGRDVFRASLVAFSSPLPNNDLPRTPHAGAGLDVFKASLTVVSNSFTSRDFPREPIAPEVVPCLMNSISLEDAHSLEQKQIYSTLGTGCCQSSSQSSLSSTRSVSRTSSHNHPSEKDVRSAKLRNDPTLVLPSLLGRHYAPALKVSTVLGGHALVQKKI